MKKLIFSLVSFILMILLFNTYKSGINRKYISSAEVPKLTDQELKNFQDAIKCPTISFGDTLNWDSIPFLDFRYVLERNYPLVHKNLKREIVGNYSYIYTWQGTDEKLNPYILMAHQDVVPIEENTQNLWTVKPFDGIIKDGYIWGRGATDDKINLISILEASEKLLQSGFNPKRTILFIFGQDEELGGRNGAIPISKLLENRGVKADLILDEGGFVTNEKIPHIDKPVAMLATAEKGYMSIELSVNIHGGHSSLPENETAMDVLMKSIVNLRSKPFEARFIISTKDFITSISPQMNFPYNVIMSNYWLFKPLILSQYKKSAPTNAMIRTTLVPTIFQSGIKDNVVPTYAKAIINLRLLPGDSSKEIINLIEHKINDKRVKVNIYGNNLSEASPTMPMSSHAYTFLDSIVRLSFDKTITAPILLTGGTDSRYFYKISNNIIKFSPMIDPIGFHGINERVSIESYRHAIWFYENLLRNSK